MPTAKTITYLIEFQDNTQRKVTVPADWNVTFGALVPGSTSNMGKWGLRFWKGTQQKAVFQGVESFRDMAIEIEERITQVKKETFYKDDGEGGKKAVVVEGKVHEWVNPDNPRPQKNVPALRDLKVVGLD